MALTRSHDTSINCRFVVYVIVTSRGSAWLQWPRRW